MDKLNIKQFPCIIVIDDNYNLEIARLIGFISSKTIDNIIEHYEETNRM